MKTYSPQAPKENVIERPDKFPLVCFKGKSASDYSKQSVPHWHKEVEIICLDKGSLTLNVHTSPINLSSPCIVVISSKHIHSIKLDKSSDFRFINFDAEIMRFAYYDKSQTMLLDSLLDPSYPIKVLTEKSTNDLNEAIKAFNLIYDNYQTKDESMQLYLKVNLLLLFSILDRAGVFSKVEIKTNLEQKRQKKLKDLIIWIQEHHSGPLTIADAASRMKFSESYFCRFFKQVMHVSFTEYVNDYRLTQAADDIMTGKKSISEIAASHGFENESYFFRSFKKKYKTTPLNYRNS